MVNNSRFRKLLLDLSEQAPAPNMITLRRRIRVVLSLLPL